MIRFSVSESLATSLLKPDGLSTATPYLATV